MGRRCVLLKGCVLTTSVTFWWRVGDGSDREAPPRQAEATAQTSLPLSSKISAGKLRA